MYKHDRKTALFYEGINLVSFLLVRAAARTSGVGGTCLPTNLCCRQCAAFSVAQPQVPAPNASVPLQTICATIGAVYSIVISASNYVIFG